MKALPVLLTCLPLYAATQNLSTGSCMVTTDLRGHSSGIKSIHFTEDHQKVISVSDDKTIRVWDVESGALVQTIRGDMDESNYGMLNASALWPGSPVVAVGGSLAVTESLPGAYVFIIIQRVSRWGI